VVIPSTVAAPAGAVVHPGPWRAIVVGGGHAGTEAALVLARGGIETLLLSQNVDRIGWMSCNPAIGGIGKSHLVAEIDAMGGYMAQAADLAGVHYKWLNASRGPAVRALRVQCDKLAYATAVRTRLEQTPHLHIKQADVSRLWLDDGGALRGVVTSQGLAFAADTVVLTAGTFLDAVLHTGLSQQRGGRMGDGPSVGLGDQFRQLGVTTLRHKTGTCPRVDGRTVNWSELEPDPGEAPPTPLSRWSAGVALPQMHCHLVHTNPITHQIIRDHLDRSPLFSGIIEGTGPRYCPSIEDKVVRFPQHNQHYLFLEREGWQTQEIYLSGLSTSLPADAQLAMVRSLPGLQRAEVVRFGYAVEYDAIDARQLDLQLQLRALPGLFLAGQINGTSGYEEAAGQGLVAGIGALQRLRGAEPVQFSRTDSYLGVMVSDLTSQGAEEPYRMFTSRAEHRLHLRVSNADIRVGPLAQELGLLTADQWQQMNARQERLAAGTAALESTVTPSIESLAHLTTCGLGGLTQPQTLAQLICRPDVQWDHLQPWLPAELHTLDTDDQQELMTAARYAGYLAREGRRIARAERHEHVQLPADMDYAAIGGLSRECIQKLQQVRPATLGHAAQVPGMTPAAVQAVAFALRQRTLSPRP
jgi:tRNA uridine 5-carboxymethylaminomethyl modification enzyme